MCSHVHLIAHFLLSQMRDVNASIPTVQLAYGRPMWGSLPGLATRNSYAFVSKHAFDKNIAALYGLSKNTVPVTGCRAVTKKDKWNDALPGMSVGPESYEVYADGVLADVEPARKVPLAFLNSDGWIQKVTLSPCLYGHSGWWNMRDFTQLIRDPSDPRSHLPVIHDTSVSNEKRKLPRKVQAGSKEMTNAPVPIR